MPALTKIEGILNTENLSEQKRAAINAYAEEVRGIVARITEINKEITDKYQKGQDTHVKHGLIAELKERIEQILKEVDEVLRNINV